MQSCGRFIQHIQCAPRILTGKLGRKFDPLRFAAGKRRGWLPQSYVPKPHIIERLEFLCKARQGREECKRLLHSHIQHIRNGFPFIAHLERFTVVALSMAYFARHINVRQKMHLNFDNAIPPAGLAASTLHIEAEAAVAIAPHARIRRLRIDVADEIKQPRIGSRITARRAPNGRLINVDDLIELLYPQDRVVISWSRTRAIELAQEGLLYNLIDQTRFPAA